MNNFYIYLGMAAAAILVLFLVFKPEFSLITTKDANTRIISVTPSGGLVQSDNTVQNINDYISNTINDTKTALSKEIEAAKTSVLSTAEKLYQPKGDYLRNKDRVAFGRGIWQPNCGGDCRAVTNFWNPERKDWGGSHPAGWQWGKPGSVRYAHATDGKIYLIRAG